MYLGVLLIVIALFAVIAGIFSGGVFTIILVPVAAIAVVGALVALGAARALGIDATLTRSAGTQPKGRIPRDGGPPPGEVPATPDEYVETRRRSQ